MPRSRPPASGDPTPRPTATQQAAEARARTLATKAWRRFVTAAAEDTTWRVKKAWIQETDGAPCAVLTHVSTGQVRALRFGSMGNLEACRRQIVEDAELAPMPVRLYWHDGRVEQLNYCIAVGVTTAIRATDSGHRHFTFTDEFDADGFAVFREDDDLGD